MKIKNFSFILIILIISAAFTSCRQNSDVNDLNISAKNGFHVAYSFENDTWTFPKVGDGIDKTIILEGTVPDAEAEYSVNLYMDYWPQMLPIEKLSLDFTTLSPDKNSSQSTSVFLNFFDTTKVVDLSVENGKQLKRVEQTVYTAKHFQTTGLYQFILYSHHPKISLPGIKTLHLVVEKNN